MRCCRAVRCRSRWCGRGSRAWFSRVQALCRGGLPIICRRQCRPARQRDRGRRVQIRRPRLRRGCPYLVQILAHEIQNVLAVETEHATRATARPVESERGHAGDDVTTAEVIGTAGGAKAGAAARGVVGQDEREVSCKAGRVDLYEPGFREHPDFLGLDEDGIDLLEPVPHRGKPRRVAGLQRVELVDAREFSVGARREFDFSTEQHDSHVMSKELGFGEQRMGMPFLRLDGVPTCKRIVVVAVLDIRFGEDAHAAELARLARAMSGGEDDFGGDQGPGAAECWLAGDVHDDEHHGGMGIAVERTVCNKRRTIRGWEIRHGSVAAEQAATESSKRGDKNASPHDSSERRRWRTGRSPVPRTGPRAPGQSLETTSSITPLSNSGSTGFFRNPAAPAAFASASTFPSVNDVMTTTGTLPVAVSFLRSGIPPPAGIIRSSRTSWGFSRLTAMNPCTGSSALTTS